MNEPIINPKWIYMIDVFNTFDFVLLLLSGVIGSILLASILFYALWKHNEYNFECESDRILNKLYKKGMVILTIILSISIIGVTAIPSEKTLYTMLTLNYITPQNIDIVGDSVTDCVDYIFEKIDEVKTEE